MPGADAFLGKITPEALARADRLRWVQAFTASLEHYIFPALVAHPCTLTNMRGLFGDVIADQVMGYILCFARNLHTYIRRQVEHRYEPVGGESARVSFATGPGVINAMDRATIYLPDGDAGDRRPRRHRLRDRAAGPGLRHDRPRRRPPPRAQRQSPRASTRSRESTSSMRCWPPATSSSSPPHRRPRRPACSTPRRSRTCGRPAT